MTMPKKRKQFLDCQKADQADVVLHFDISKGLYFSGQYSERKQQRLIDTLALKYSDSLFDSKRLIMPSDSSQSQWLEFTMIQTFAKKLMQQHTEFLFLEYSSVMGPFERQVNLGRQARFPIVIEDSDDELSTITPEPSFEEYIQTQKKRFDGKQKIAVSVNDGGHYYIILLDLSDSSNLQFVVMDSLNCQGNHKKFMLNLVDFLATVLPHVEKCSGRSIRMPKQTNNDDCGVSLCGMMALFVKNELKPLIQSLQVQESFDYSPFRQHIAQVLDHSEPNLLLTARKKHRL